MDPTFTQVLDYVGKATVITVLAVGLWGVFTRRWYPAWYVNEQKEEIARLRAENATWSSLLTRLIKPILPKDE